MKTEATKGFRDMRHRSSVDRGDPEIRSLNDVAAITNPETQPLAESDISTRAIDKVRGCERTSVNAGGCKRIRRGENNAPVPALRNGVKRWPKPNRYTYDAVNSCVSEGTPSEP